MRVHVGNESIRQTVVEHGLVRGVGVWDSGRWRHHDVRAGEKGEEGGGREARWGEWVWGSDRDGRRGAGR